MTERLRVKPWPLWPPFLIWRAAQGRGTFTDELNVLRKAVKFDPALDEQAAKLEAFAAAGVPSLAALQADLAAHELPATVSDENTSRWWQRILQHLKGIVSIHPAHDPAYAPLEKAVAAGHLDEAVAQVKNLPAEAQQNVADWRKDAEARATLDDTLHAIGIYFTAPTAGDAP